MSESISPERWERLRSLLNDALERPAADRITFLDAACAGDSELRADADALLEAHDAMGSVDAIAAVLQVDRPAVEDLSDRRIGAYRLVRPIAHGGMGAVYLAERVDGQFEQRAALKLLRAGFESDEVRRRFLEERSILARLEHPNIARLLDGGITGDGQPYFVMEYVAGEPITEYCRGLGVHDRLALFLQVCAAVQYAHQNLVVHRDLKPSNILVTEDGQVKLLDFGIAKLLADDAGAAARTTRLWLTPEYAAPEQVRGQPVSTAADVYTLGVVLYELLAGRRPYRLDASAPAEIQRIVCDVEPAPPSAAAEPGERRRLEGDLDTIVLQSMRKEPQRRYVGAAQLAEDVERHLAGLPVHARPATIRYRTAKFVRRHRLGVAGAAVLVLAVAGGVAGTTWQAERAHAQARLAQQERDRARIEAVKADRVSDFLIDLFQVSDPAQSMGDVITARALLDSGATRIRAELRDEPAVQAQLMDVIGVIYAKLGLYDAAEPLVEEGLALRRATPGVEPTDVAESLSSLGTLAYYRGRYDDAERAWREALALRRQSLPDPHADLAASLNNLGVLLHERDDYAGAERYHRDALAMRLRLPELDSAEIAVNMTNLAGVLKERGAFEPADSLLRHALAIRRALLGDLHPDVAHNLNNLGALLMARSEVDAALPLLRESLDIRRGVLGENHPLVAQSMNNVAAALERKGDLTEAESLYRESLARKRAAVGDAHPSIATSLNNIALVLMARGDLAGAEPLLRESLAVRRKVFGESHGAVALAINSLASLLRRRSDFTAAETEYRRALVMRREVLGARHPETAITALSLGSMFHDLGRDGEAVPLLQDALAARQESFGATSWQAAQVEMTLGECLAALGRSAEAEPLLIGGHARLIADSTAPPPALQRADSVLAAHYDRTGKAELAARLRSRGAASRRSS
jgi:serine/threonine-protein kinase